MWWNPATNKVIGAVYFSPGAVGPPHSSHGGSIITAVTGVFSDAVARVCGWGYRLDAVSISLARSVPVDATMWFRDLDVVVCRDGVVHVRSSLSRGGAVSPSDTHVSASARFSLAPGVAHAVPYERLGEPDATRVLRACGVPSSSPSPAL